MGNIAVFYDNYKWSITLNFFFFCLFRAAPAAYGGSQGLTGAVAAGLCHSHSHAGSEPHLQPVLKLMATLDP